MERRHSFASSAIGVFAVLALAFALAASLGAAPAIAQADDSLTAGAIAQQVTGKATAAKAQVNVKSLEKNREFTFTDMPMAVPLEPAALTVMLIARVSVLPVIFTATSKGVIISFPAVNVGVL